MRRGGFLFPKPHPGRALVTFFIPGGAWRTATLDMGPVRLLLGPVLGAAVDVVIVAWLVFWFSKQVLKEATVTKK